MLTYNALFNIVALSTAICRASAVADPSKVFFTVGAYGFGDWGKSLDDASCCSGDHTFYDVQAQKTVATLMDIYAGQNGLPNVLLAHGDNFYWTGINSESDIIPRFTTSYENVYNGQNIRNIPTLATLGNHDMGGADYICSKDDKLVPCTSEKELTEGLFNKAFWQSKYESPNNKRWHMEGRYFTYWIEGMDHVSIEVFNIDTNDADVAGMKSVCCQCQGYAKAKKSTDKCGSVDRGDEFCFGGNTTLYDACIDSFVAWGELSRKRLAQDAAASTATWKLVNTHFSFVQHFNEEGMTKWIDALKDSGVQVYFYGHTHGEKHDFSESLHLHLVENGAGGGAKKEKASTIPSYAASIVKNLWSYSGNEYGFMSVKASKDWMKLEYVTAGDDWVFTDNFDSTKIGSAVTKHCWLIPNNGTLGQLC